MFVRLQRAAEDGRWLLPLHSDRRSAIAYYVASSSLDNPMMIAWRQIDEKKTRHRHRSIMMCVTDDSQWTKKNKERKLAKCGIAVACPPQSSLVFARWQHRTGGLATISNCTFWLGVQPPNFPFPTGPGIPWPWSNTLCHWTAQVYLPNGIKVCWGTNVTDRRQTTLRRNV